MTRFTLAALLAASLAGPWGGCERDPVTPPASPPPERAPDATRRTRGASERRRRRARAVDAPPELTHALLLHRVDDFTRRRGMIEIPPLRSSTARSMSSSRSIPRVSRAFETCSGPEPTVTAAGGGRISSTSKSSRYDRAIQSSASCCRAPADFARTHSLACTRRMPRICWHPPCIGARRSSSGRAKWTRRTKARAIVRPIDATAAAFAKPCSETTEEERARRARDLTPEEQEAARRAEEQGKAKKRPGVVGAGNVTALRCERCGNEYDQSFTVAARKRRSTRLRLLRVCDRRAGPAVRALRRRHHRPRRASVRCDLLLRALRAR